MTNTNKTIKKLHHYFVSFIYTDKDGEQSTAMGVFFLDDPIIGYGDLVTVMDKIKDENKYVKKVVILHWQKFEKDI